jgi:hypothetical protein
MAAICQRGQYKIGSRLPTKEILVYNHVLEVKELTLSLQKRLDTSLHRYDRLDSRHGPT